MRQNFIPTIRLCNPSEIYTPHTRSRSNSWNWLIILKIVTGEDILSKEVLRLTLALIPTTTWVELLTAASCGVTSLNFVQISLFLELL